MISIYDSHGAKHARAHERLHAKIINMHNVEKVERFAYFCTVTARARSPIFQCRCLRALSGRRATQRWGA
jgi:hypothetical protein